MKICNTCNVEKPLSEFHNNKRRKDGKENRCKICQNKLKRERAKYKDYKRKHKERYKNDPEYRQMAKDKAAKYRREHNEYVLLSQAKVRAKQFGLDFNITIDDIIIPDLCPILNIPLYRGTNKKNDNSPSLDRINNLKGYIKGNVRIISNLANTMKNKASIEQLKTFAKNIISYINNEDIVRTAAIDETAEVGDKEPLR